MSSLIKFNKGEWSEVYVFFKILGDGKLVAGRNRFTESNEFYPILKILTRDIESNSFLDYCIEHKDTINFESDYIYILKNNELISDKIDAKYYQNLYIELRDCIKQGKGRTFSIPKIEEELEKNYLRNIKSSSDKKHDIEIELKDLKLLKDKVLKFSIKSFLGSPPTIINASDSTNFRYKICNVKEEDIKKINEKTNTRKNGWLKDKIKYIKSNYDVQYDTVVNETFKNNLRFIDSNLDLILSDLLLEYYSNRNLSSIDKLINCISVNNILNIQQEINYFYKKKIISLIKACSLGMMPNKPWMGEYEVDGGIIIVLKNGETELYHLYYDNKYLEDVFYKNTKLETPSTTRYKMGDIYRINDEFYFNLNLQLRYK